VKYKRLAARLSLAAFLCLAAFGLALMVVPMPLDKLEAPQAYRYFDRHDQLVHVLISDDGFYRLSVELNELPELFIETLLLQEDQYFYKHPGVNPLAVLRAASSNLFSGRVVSGASTITMQLARMLERRPRTIPVKLLEMFRAVQLEMRYSKAEILQHYLSIAPYGGNLEGINAATYAYFGKPASQLSPAQMALLVLLPKSPNGWRPDRYPIRAKSQRDQLLAKMHDQKLISEQTYQRALAEPVPDQRLSFPTKIPHLAWSLRSEFPDKNLFNTTIDYNIQIRSQRLVREYVSTLSDRAINNAAVVVLDSKTRELRAMVGSADYFDEAAEGANNGATALRSPGSTLKPFLYGLAMDAGLIAEKTVLEDIPISVAGYSPRNYSKTFRGTVTVREALIDSLNVVAVRLSQKLGINALYDLLKKGGVSSLLEPASYYGLPLVLGGVEVSLLELTSLYTALANYGSYQPYVLLRNKKGEAERQAITEADPIQLLSEEASWLISDMLTDVERPDFPSVWQYSTSRPTLAWKTGTSYGHQDAWSMGYHPEYTVGVWVGNFDGTPAKELSGDSAAGPLFFDIMQAIVQEPTRWFAKPIGIENRLVCGTCGLPGNPYCPNTTVEQYIPSVKGAVTENTCQVPQKVITATGEETLIEVWPSELAGFLHQHGLPVTNVPAYDLNNMSGQIYYPPVIQSPVEGAQYIRRYDHIASQDQQIKLQAAVTNRIKTVNWYIDDKLFATSDKPYEPIYFNPAPGEYSITLVDDVGGRDEMTLVVKDYRSELAQ